MEQAPADQVTMESGGEEEPQLDVHRLQRDEEGGGGGHEAGRQRASLLRPLWLSATPGGEGTSLVPGIVLLIIKSHL